jgi:hypothetical protein
LVVGHSHVGAIRQAAIARREADPDRPRTRTIYLPDPAFGGEMEGGHFSPGIVRAIKDQLERHAPIVASAIGGNTHAALTLIPYRRIDFHLSGDDALPLDPEAELLSEDQMRGQLTEALQRELLQLRLLRDIAGPFWHLESPPPVRRKDWVQAKAEAYFTEKPEFHTLGVAEAGIRYRSWRLAYRIVREQVEKLGCYYVPVPNELCGEAGLLRPSMGHDATHGNQVFGEAMIRALERAVAESER